MPWKDGHWHAPAGFGCVCLLQAPGLNIRVWKHAVVHPFRRPHSSLVTLAAGSVLEGVHGPCCNSLGVNPALISVSIKVDGVFDLDVFKIGELHL
jgi:hypothetical protein